MVLLSHLYACCLGLFMTILLLFLGLLPMLFLPDIFGGEDAYDSGNGTGGLEDDGYSDDQGGGADQGFPDEVFEGLVVQPDDSDDQPPVNPAPIDEGSVVQPDDGDDSPDDFDYPIGDGGVLDPVDTPEEEYSFDGDGTLLQRLLGEQSDAATGIGYIGTQISDTLGSELGTANDTFEMEDDGTGGNGEGQLGSWDGTPLIDTEGNLNVVSGGEGNDSITAGDEAAYIFGGVGDDTLAAGDGAVAVFGGIGEDTITGSDVVNSDGTASAHLDGGAGDDIITGGEGHEIIQGGEHGDQRASGNDVLSGGGGNDFVSGGYGADTIAGGAGDDVLDHFGQADERVVAERREYSWHIDNNADTLDGGEGNDTIIFDRTDTATGGEGNDTFWLYNDTSSGTGHADITDFRVGEDFLRISLNPDVTAGTPEVVVEPSDDGSDGIVFINGAVVAILQGSPGASAADIYVDVPENIFR